ncbi:MAG: GNAT family N-acetyltransferase [Candidatus Margulisiibacteriota bacterium]
MIKLIRYQPDQKNLWDDFLTTVKNPHFFFNRAYMDYHSDRFNDHSLLVYHRDELVALFPANEQDHGLYSHQGLSFGGLLMSSKVTAAMACGIIEALKLHGQAYGFKHLLYKAMPSIYHQLPSQEDLYALTLAGARLIRRDLSTTVDIHRRLPYQERRRRGIKKATQNHIHILEETPFDSFWRILSDALERHDTKPVHTLQEITLLHSRFPQNIRLVCAKKEEETVAGVVVFETNTVAHAQYIASSPQGRELGALDAIFDHLITTCTKNHFDFGISTTEQGKMLNQGLVEQKEGFGGRAIVHDFYQLDL